MKFRLGIQSYPILDSQARKSKGYLVDQPFSKTLQVLKLYVCCILPSPEVCLVCLSVIRILFLFLSSTKYTEVLVKKFAHALVQVSQEIVHIHNLHTPQPQKIECQICADMRTVILNGVFPQQGISTPPWTVNKSIFLYYYWLILFLTLS